MPTLEFRTRDTNALLSEAEWGWSARAGEAWVFDSYDAGASATFESDATRHVAVLKSAGVDHVFAVVVCADPRLQAERERRHRDRDARIESIVPPEECYRRTSARMGERE